jgi:hypothetical protein
MDDVPVPLRSPVPGPPAAVTLLAGLGGRLRRWRP